MPIKKHTSSMPPVPPRKPAGTETSDAYGHVISTRPLPASGPAHPAGPAAPTSDAWGHVISTPPGYVEPHPLPPGAVVGPGRAAPTSTIQFVVDPGMRELKDFASSQGWAAKGFTHLSVPWQEIVYTTDNWKTTRTLKSSDVPSPLVNGRFTLPNVPRGTQIEFALHVGVACQAPSDIAGYRERGSLWLNNDGHNFKQVSQ